MATFAADDIVAQSSVAAISSKCWIIEEWFETCRAALVRTWKSIGELV
jgi:hypothetical protein